MLIIAATPKFAAQSIRKAFEIGWRPMTFLSNVAVWVSTVMEPAGLEAGVGILSTAYVKDPDDPAWKDDAGVKGWREFMIKYVPEADLHDTNYVNAYNSAMALEAVLKACGDDLSTENILRQAYAIKDLELPMLLPGIKVNTSPTDHVPVDQMQFMRFNGKSWDRFGELADRELTAPSSGAREPGIAGHRRAPLRRRTDGRLSTRSTARRTPNLKISSTLSALLMEQARSPSLRRAKRASHGHADIRPGNSRAQRHSRVAAERVLCAVRHQCRVFPGGVRRPLVDLRRKGPGHPDRFRQRLVRRQAGARWPPGAGL